MIVLNKKLKVSVQFLFLTLLLNSCHGQTNATIEECKVHIVNASKIVNSFYVEKNQNSLSDALKEVELSINCPETKKKSIEMKISILALQLEYDKASEFINTLSEDDFAKPYKKNMQYYLFKGLSFESKADKKNRDINLQKSVQSINQFIEKNNSVDQEAYYDLFFVKSKMISQNEMVKELDGLKKKYPSDKEFFEILKESFNEEIKLGTLQKAD